MIVTFTWTASTEPSSVVLSDPTGNYGVRRTADSLVIVPDGTAMSSLGSGSYSYEFTDPDTNLSAEYEVWIEIIDGIGIVYRLHKYIKSAGAVVTLGKTIDSAALVLAEVLRKQGALSNLADVFLSDTTSKPVWPSGIGGMVDKPDEFVALYDSGGVIDTVVPDAEGYAAIEHNDVQLRIRAKNGQYAVAKQKARELKDLLVNTRNYEISIANEIPEEASDLFQLNVATPLSKEAYIGPDDKGRPTFTLNVRTSITRIVNN